MNKPRLILDPKKVNETIKVILDTGSNISLINRKLLTEEMKSMIHNSKDIVEFPLLGIKESNVQDVNIQLGDDVYKFIVTDVEVVDVLIGNDILKESIIDQQKQLLILNNRRYRITYQKSKEYKCNLNTEEEEYINSKFEEDEDIKDKVIEIVENLPSTICDILVKTNPSEEEIEIITNFISEEFEDVIVEKLPEISDQLKKSRRNKIIHISGNKNGVADFLSRKYDSFQWDASFLEKIKEEQEGSEWLKEMKNNQNLCIEGTNDIYYLVEDGIRKLIIIEKETIDKIVREYHDAKYSGHKSFEVVYNNIRHDYYFRDMYSIIKRYIKSCAVCQLNINRKETGLLQSLEIPYEVWRDISMDFVSMPKSKMAMNGFQVEVDQCCMIVCRLSKMIHAIPCAKTINAEHTAQLMLNHVFRLHGYPRTIVSDRDPKFISEIWRLWAETMDSKLKMTVAHRAKGDGQTERKIQEFVAILTKMSSTYGEGWADLTALAEFAMNSSISKVTKMSPFQAVYGFNPPTPVSHFNTLTRTKIPLSSIKKIIRDNILDAQITSQKYYNKNRGKAPDYKIGDKVFVKRKYFETGLSKDIISKKLESKNCCPFKIIEVNGNNVTLDLISYPRKHNVFNVDQLVQLFEDDDWIRNEISMPDAEETEESTYEVEKIINYDRKHRRYLAKFVGYPEPEWVKEEDANCDELIKEYWEVQNEKLNSKQGRESRQQENLESIVHPETSNISLSDRSESNFQDPEIPENFNKSKAGRKRVNSKGGESEVVKSKVTKSGRTSKPPSRF
ncbi:hypothetical protein RB653_007958 [Dictyostelium firmibasis]|uniref:Integrase catalytic domain-containing protein n=1 Tax=Dictyostelium firmibasis TaxID=79012 RepID=A0AAN7YMF4_9MYCE